MAHIKSRKHTVVRRVNACSAAVAMAFVAFPGAASAQQTSADTSTNKTETLPQITVQGQAESYKADTVSSPKFTQPLLNTAQTISVIKSELVQQQGRLVSAPFRWARTVIRTPVTRFICAVSTHRVLSLSMACVI
jgi:catecholate siderophore receptor